jgi:hypothetical protein
MRASTGRESACFCHDGEKNTFLSIFSLNFRFASIFHLIFAYFTFIFASDFWCFASK